MIIYFYLFLYIILILYFLAFKKGGRWPWFWFATIVHGLISDNFWQLVLPEYDNLWHSQSPVMLFGLRQPLHIIFLCKFVIHLSN